MTQKADHLGELRERFEREYGGAFDFYARKQFIIQLDRLIYAAFEVATEREGAAAALVEMEGCIHAVAVKHGIALREQVVRDMVAYLREVFDIRLRNPRPASPA